MDIEELTRCIKNFSFGRCESGGRGYERILLQLFGFLGHGKSSFINSCKYVLDDEDYVNYAGANMSNTRCSSARISYKLTESITLVDNRGCEKMDSHKTGEIFAQLGNVLPLDVDVEWSEGLQLVDEAVDVETEVISSDFIYPVFLYSIKKGIDQEEVEDIKNLLQTAGSLTGTFPIVVLTYKTYGRLTQIEETFRKMGVERIFALENYTLEDNCRSRGRHEAILNLLFEVIKQVRFSLQHPQDRIQEVKDRIQFIQRIIRDMDRGDRVIVDRQCQTDISRWEKANKDRQDKTDMDRCEWADRCNHHDMDGQDRVNINRKDQADMEHRNWAYMDGWNHADMDRQDWTDIDKWEQDDIDRLGCVPMDKQESEVTRWDHCKIDRWEQAEMDRHDQVDVDRWEQADMDRQDWTDIDKWEQDDMDRLGCVPMDKQESEVTRWDHCKIDRWEQAEMDRHDQVDVDRRKKADMHREDQDDMDNLDQADIGREEDRRHYEEAIKNLTEKYELQRQCEQRRNEAEMREYQRMIQQLKKKSHCVLQ
ncbi:golgin subfamily A member 6-like protein 1 [Ranitomeya imitator]|uniref:golgin subfamily A member 6-like protein 1 n=1 Tax=Ranitomeya imitator TaxID=111125 RepID=UPI0037E817CD